MQHGLWLFIFPIAVLLALSFYVHISHRKLQQRINLLKKTANDVTAADLIGLSGVGAAVGLSNVGKLAREELINAQKEKHQQQIEKIRLIVSIAVTGIVLCSALYVILISTHSEESQKWAFGSVGTVIGYWLKQ